ncbi:MAG: DUF4190 domain-containing protein [Microbacterium sp.]|uniref:DUF4190 domain-containing protein n=1 Tax=Microbacterium sp. TaxID=51671 RepID=UPI0039E5D608
MSDNTPDNAAPNVPPTPAGYPGGASEAPGAQGAPEAAPAYGAPPAAPAYGAPEAAAAYGSAPAYGAAPAYPTAPGYAGYPTAPKTNTLAIVSLVSSLAGLFVVPVIGQIVGIITGHMSLSRLKTSGENGRGLALAGTIIGWVGLVLAIIGIILVISFIAWAAQNGERYSTYG